VIPQTVQDSKLYEFLHAVENYKLQYMYAFVIISDTLKIRLFAVVCKYEYSLCTIQ